MKQVKAEILTDAGSYEVDVNPPEGCHYSSLLDYWKAVQDTIAAGIPFDYGRGLLVLGSGVIIKHIIIAEVCDDVKQLTSDDVKPATPDPKTDGGFYTFIIGANYLGVPVSVKAQAFNDLDHNRTICVPMEVDERPALDLIRPENLKVILESHYLRGGYRPREYVVLTPPAQLAGYEEAALYITDYITEEEEISLTQPPRNAKAWSGYRHEGGA